MLMNQAALFRAERAHGRIWFLEKKIEISFLVHGQVQEQAQPGFQAQPGMQQGQVQVLSGYSIFWPENHLTW